MIFLHAQLVRVDPSLQQVLPYGSGLPVDLSSGSITSEPLLWGAATGGAVEPPAPGADDCWFKAFKVRATAGRWMSPDQSQDASWPVPCGRPFAHLSFG